MIKLALGVMISGNAVDDELSGNAAGDALSTVTLLMLALARVLVNALMIDVFYGPPYLSRDCGVR